jgi:hypothetical protein
LTKLDKNVIQYNDYFFFIKVQEEIGSTNDEYNYAVLLGNPLVSLKKDQPLLVKPNEGAFRAAQTVINNVKNALYFTLMDHIDESSGKKTKKKKKKGIGTLNNFSDAVTINFKKIIEDIGLSLQDINVITERRANIKALELVENEFYRGLPNNIRECRTKKIEGLDLSDKKFVSCTQTIAATMQIITDIIRINSINPIKLACLWETETNRVEKIVIRDATALFLITNPTTPIFVENYVIASSKVMHVQQFNREFADRIGINRNKNTVKYDRLPWIITRPTEDEAKEDVRVSSSNYYQHSIFERFNL